MSAGGVAHDHRTIVPDCFRCELGRDESGSLGETGGREVIVWALGITAEHVFEEELMEAAFAIAEKHGLDIGGIAGPMKED